MNILKIDGEIVSAVVNVKTGIGICQYQITDKTVLNKLFCGNTADDTDAEETNSDGEPICPPYEEPEGATEVEPRQSSFKTTVYLRKGLSFLRPRTNGSGDWACQCVDKPKNSQGRINLLFPKALVEKEKDLPMLAEKAMQEESPIEMTIRCHLEKLDGRNVVVVEEILD